MLRLNNKINNNGSKRNRRITSSCRKTSTAEANVLFLGLVLVLLLSSSSPSLAAFNDSKNPWTDPQTPEDTRSITDSRGRKLHLVFSDEFTEGHRSFADGHDTRWTAEDRPAETNAALNYYNSTLVKTDGEKGFLRMSVHRQDAHWIEHNIATGEQVQHPHRFYQSGMVTTWNKFCFTSGVVEMKFKLPGKPLRYEREVFLFSVLRCLRGLTSSLFVFLPFFQFSGGLWPAFWMLGNLARPSYFRSTQGVWPWSYPVCGTSEEAQQARAGQELSACNASLMKGRGSPEIDIIEAQPGDVQFVYDAVQQVDGSTRPIAIHRPMISSSLQVSPGISTSLRPETPNLPQTGQWYPDLFPMGGAAYGQDVTTMSAEQMDSPPRMINNYWYGQVIHDEPKLWQDGLSCNWHHGTDYYEELRTIRMEWQAPDKAGNNGYVKWYDTNGKLLYHITSAMLQKRPGSPDAVPQIPFEAMYLILNTDVSPRWGWNGCDGNADPCLQQHPEMCNEWGQLTCLDCSNPDCLRCPNTTAWLRDFCEEVDPSSSAADYIIDYVRVYQDLSDPLHTTGCDPPDYPTKEFIDEHWKRYTFDPIVQDAPLQRVQHGGGSCETDSDCGNYVSDYLKGKGNSTSQQQQQPPVGPSPLLRSSFCVDNKCQCPSDWTGPHCKSPCIGAYAHCTKTTHVGEGTNPPSTTTSSATIVLPSKVLIVLVAVAIAATVTGPFLG